MNTPITVPTWLAFLFVTALILPSLRGLVTVHKAYYCVHGGDDDGGNEPTPDPPPTLTEKLPSFR